MRNSARYEGWAWWTAGSRWEACLGWWHRLLGSPGLLQAPPCSLPILCSSLSFAGRRACSSVPWDGVGDERWETRPRTPVFLHFQPPHPAMLANLLTLLLPRVSLSSLEPQTWGHPSRRLSLLQAVPHHGSTLCACHYLAQGLSLRGRGSVHVCSLMPGLVLDDSQPGSAPG